MESGWVLRETIDGYGLGRRVNHGRIIVTYMGHKSIRFKGFAIYELAGFGRGTYQLT